jgi:hypothetical protein
LPFSLGCIAIFDDDYGNNVFQEYCSAKNFLNVLHDDALGDDELVKEVQQTMSFYQHARMDMTLKLLVHAEN